LVASTSHPLIGLFIGVLATSIAQSSSLTTSIVVSLVAGGTLTPALAIPVVMGANIGTSITNIIVSLGHLTRSDEFERAFSAATVHDIFNWFSVVLFLPLEIATGFLTKFSTWLASVVGGTAGLEFHSPTRLAISPVIGWIKGLLLDLGLSNTMSAVLLLALSGVLLFLALTGLTRTMKGILLARLQPVLSSAIARRSLVGLLFGVLFTVLVQSSSVTTSLLVPMAAAGVLTLEQVYPITLGANVGTTVTALLAASVGNVSGLAIAFAHLTFNVLGISVFFANPWGRHLIPRLGRAFGAVATQSRILVAVFILGAFFLLPGLVILIERMLSR
jgi:sodium-dependent phosphate cotransporter